jgi:hypothetical protein
MAFLWLDLFIAPVDIPQLIIEANNSKNLKSFPIKPQLFRFPSYGLER